MSISIAIHLACASVIWLPAAGKNHHISVKKPGFRAESAYLGRSGTIPGVSPRVIFGVSIREYSRVSGRELSRVSGPDSCRETSPDSCAVMSRDYRPVSCSDLCRDYRGDSCRESLGDLSGEYSGDLSRVMFGDSRLGIPDLRLQTTGIANADCRMENCGREHDAKPCSPGTRSGILRTECRLCPRLHV